ncbi:MAG: HAMP domain-containing sensor histidine kinase [Candidatus Eremiobacterota bacterium]
MKFGKLFGNIGSKILLFLILFAFLFSYIFFVFYEEDKRDSQYILSLCKIFLENKMKETFNISICVLNDVDNILDKGLVAHPFPVSFTLLVDENGSVIDKSGSEIDEVFMEKLLPSGNKNSSEMLRVMANHESGLTVVSVLPFNSEKIKGFILVGNNLSEIDIQKQIPVIDTKIGTYIDNRKVPNSFGPDNLSSEAIKELRQNNICFDNFNVNGTGYYAFIYPLNYKEGDIHDAILCAFPSDFFYKINRQSLYAKIFLILLILFFLLIPVLSFNRKSEDPVLQDENEIELTDRENLELANIKIKKINEELKTKTETIKKSRDEAQQNRHQMDYLIAKCKKNQDELDSLKKANEEIQLNKNQMELVNIKLKKAQAELESMDKIKAQFLSNINHEFRTPVALIIGFSEILLADEKLDREQKNLVNDIYNASTRLRETVDNILALPESIKFEKKDRAFKEVNLLETIEKVKKTFKGEIEKKNLNILTNLSDHIPSKILIEDEELEHIFNNLLSNAVKFTGNEGTITIKAEITKNNPYGLLHNKNNDKKGNYLNISITDTGIGIKPQDQQKLFQKEFWQADSSSTRAYEGSGLGLIITKKLVEDLGGTIWFYSKEGEGSTFGFVIPVEEEHS